MYIIVERWINQHDTTEAWDNEKIWVPDTIRTHDFPNTALSTELREIIESKVTRVLPCTWHKSATYSDHANKMKNMSFSIPEL